MLAATPILVKTLGVEQFGLWTFTMAVTGFGGISSMGMGPATIKYVSDRRGRDDPSGAAEMLRIALGITLIASAGMAGLLIVGSGFLAEHVFWEMGERLQVQQALWFAALLILVQQFDSVFSAAIKGEERFDLAAQLEALSKLIIVVGGVAAAVVFRSFGEFVSAIVAFTAVSIVAKAIVVGKLMDRQALLPQFRGLLKTGIVKFGLWNWIQTIAGVLFSNLDRLLIASILGPQPLAVYGVSLQLAQQVHAVPCAAMSFLFPMMSRKLAAMESDGIFKVCWYGVTMNLMLTAVLSAILLLYGEQIMILWMGPEFASQTDVVLNLLVIAMIILSINISPHYLLLGMGYVQFVSMSNILGSCLGIGAAIVLVPILGISGAAVSRMCLGIAALVNQFKLFRECRSSKGRQR
jgi:O-antigen/teichoic acid export membrane protein